MLSRKNRLNLRVDRFRLEREGTKQHTPLFVIISTPSQLSQPRFAILVSKKLARLSVDRHRLKRVITEVLRHHLERFPVRDYILIPKKSALAATQADFLSDILQISEIETLKID